MRDIAHTLPSRQNSAEELKESTLVRPKSFAALRITRDQNELTVSLKEINLKIKGVLDIVDRVEE